MASLRWARPVDYAAFADLFPELGTDDPVPSEAAWREGLAPSTAVAESEGRVIGYCYFQRYASEGYVRHLVVAPGARGAGVGRSLMVRVAEELVSRGARAWRLNVMVENAPALALYLSLGFSQQYLTWALDFPWAATERLPPGSTKVRAREVRPEEEVELEEAFGLPIGLLRPAREKIICQLRDEGGAPAGLAVFDPAFPGAYPFRVKRVEDAAALLRALRPHAIHPELIKLVAEGDAALAEALLAAGGTLRHRIAHLWGTLPPKGA
jgi:GNAT superfamily N-acetyltransferase